MTIDFWLLKEEIVEDEADRRWPYDDRTGRQILSLPSGGNLTIGVGRNLFGKPLSKSVVDLMFKEDINEALEICLNIFLGFDTFTQKRKHALINMAFNLGHVRLSLFKKMIAAIKTGDWEIAANEAKDSEWYNQIGNRAKRIVEDLRNG